MSEPTIPTKPAMAQAADETPEVLDEEAPEEEAPKGGRPSNKQLAADNKRLVADNDRLRDIVAIVASIPEERDKADSFVLFDLSRAGQTTRITNGAVRQARKLLSK